MKQEKIKRDRHDKKQGSGTTFVGLGAATNESLPIDEMAAIFTDDGNKFTALPVPLAEEITVATIWQHFGYFPHLEPVNGAQFAALNALQNRRFKMCNALYPYPDSVMIWNACKLVLDEWPDKSSVRRMAEGILPSLWAGVRAIWESKFVGTTGLWPSQETARPEIQRTKVWTNANSSSRRSDTSESTSLLFALETLVTDLRKMAACHNVSAQCEFVLKPSIFATF